MWSLIHTQPKRSALATRIARPTSRVQTDEARPYGVPLAHAIASASSENCWTVITGPKISRWIISSSWLQAGDDGRLEEEAGPVGLVAAGDDLDVAGLALEEALDALALAGGVERPERRVGRARVAHHQALGLLGQPGDDVVVDLGAGEHARRGRAVLAGVVVAGAGDRLERGLEVDVVEHDHRRLAAELEVDALERVGGGAGDPLAGLDRAGQRDHVDVVVGDERLAGRVAVAGDHVQHALGQDLGRVLGQLQRRQRASSRPA